MEDVSCLPVRRRSLPFFGGCVVVVVCVCAGRLSLVQVCCCCCDRHTNSPLPGLISLSQQNLTGDTPNTHFIIQNFLTSPY